jgi:hypothetical protein
MAAARNELSLSVNRNEAKHLNGGMKADHNHMHELCTNIFMLTNSMEQVLLEKPAVAQILHKLLVTGTMFTRTRQWLLS